MRTAFTSAKRALRLLALASVLAMLAVACGGEDPDPTPTSAPQQAAPTATPTAEAMMEEKPTPTAEAMMEEKATPTPEAMTENPDPTPTPRPTPTPIPVEEQVDFSGKTVQITVGYAPGGGFDTFARIFAHHLSDELEGNPNVFVSNKPGANTLVAVRSVIDKDYRDNQVDIVVVISTLIQQSILGGVSEFDAANDLVYLGAPDYTPSDQTWCIRSDLAANLDEYLAGNYSLGQIGRVDTYATSSEWAVQVGFPFERVFGYTGTSDMDAAFNRREIDVTPTCRDSQVAQNPEWAEGYATPLFYTIMEPEWIKAGKAEGKYEWVKSIREIAQERFGAGDDYLNAFDALMAAAASSRIYAMPSQTPTTIVNEMRAAFERVVSSADFVADMKSRRYDVGLRTGDQYQTQVESFAGLPEETLAIIRGLFPG
ncbi:MAG: hypothetical protein OXE50_04715 [Chloroflexi bacterium]|nr:hypothetical protein [Chloroflexota bacterium]